MSCHYCGNKCSDSICVSGKRFHSIRCLVTHMIRSDNPGIPRRLFVTSSCLFITLSPRLFQFVNQCRECLDNRLDNRLDIAVVTLDQVHL